VIASTFTLAARRALVVKVRYEIVEHDGGWAYKMQGVFSEPFGSHAEALNAAERAASEQQVPGETSPIEYEDAKGKWHEEVARGSDRPTTEVEDGGAS
jgi:hypothetical protein